MIPLTCAYGRCIIQEFFGIYCPGCGGTRAFEALLRLDVIHSLYYNPGAVIIVIAITLALIPKVFKRTNTERYHRARRVIYAACAFAWIGFTVIRNILLLNGIDMLGDLS